MPAELPCEPHGEPDAGLSHWPLCSCRQRVRPLRRGRLPTRLEWIGDDLLQPVQPALRFLPELGHQPAVRRLRVPTGEARRTNARPPAPRLSQHQLRHARASLTSHSQIPRSGRPYLNTLTPSRIRPSAPPRIHPMRLPALPQELRRMATSRTDEGVPGSCVAEIDAATAVALQLRHEDHRLAALT